MRTMLVVWCLMLVGCTHQHRMSDWHPIEPGQEHPLVSRCLDGSCSYYRVLSGCIVEHHNREPN